MVRFFLILRGDIVKGYFFLYNEVIRRWLMKIKRIICLCLFICIAFSSFFVSANSAMKQWREQLREFYTFR